jgi:serine/threonine protein phosphatase PrpC
MIVVFNFFRLNNIGSRQNNEDAIFPSLSSGTAGNLFMVCDGVGGAAKGEVASQLACAIFSENILSTEPNDIDATFLQKTAGIASEKFRAYLQQHPDSQGMATTLTLAVLKNNSILLAWCGDSRIYHIRDGKILFRTKDHSLVQQLISMGDLTEEEAINHPNKNKILRAVNEKMRPEDLEMKELTDLKTGDYILLCSDGLLENIKEQVMSELFTAQNSGKDFAKEVNGLCEGKTSDNYSMVLIQLDGESDNKNLKPQKKGNSKKILFIVMPLLFIGILALGYFLFRKYF